MRTLTTRARRATAALGVAALGMTATAGAAFAQDTGQYPPTTPTSAAGTCVGTIPYLSYSVNFGPEFAGETVTITIPNPNGPDIVVTRTLGPDGSLSGNDILWPGANDDPPDWPGYIFTDGSWVEGDDGFLWARGTIEIIFETNPTVTTQAVYPPPSSVCHAPPTGDTPPPNGTTPENGTTTTTTTGLPVTGAQAATLGITGGALLLGGTAMVVSSRRRGARVDA